MTRPRASLDGLRKLRVWEYLVRFAFGGAITALAGWLGGHYGLAIAGICLAFPAILPASLTLVDRHDGRRSALDDARGGQLGAIALACFALVVSTGATSVPFPVCLALAVASWLVLAVALWWIVLGRR